MPTETPPLPVSTGLLWAGWIVTGLVVLFLTFDGVMKVVRADPAVEGTVKLGVPDDAVVSIGLVLLAVTAIYASPPTAVLGAVLLTGYLGGAAAIHVRAGSGAFPVAFSIGFAVLAWVGLVLRDPRLFWTILLRQ
jgi:hypothetical protein